MATEEEQFPRWVRDTRPPVPMPPAGSCDSQFHIYGDIDTYPPRPDAIYQPVDASFADALVRKILVDNPARLHGFPD